MILESPIGCWLHQRMVEEFADPEKKPPRRSARKMTEYRAEMAAVVYSVLVAEGDAVSAGDTLLILEAMKMEIPIVAESAGSVMELPANVGDTVEEGDVLALIN
jgi:acetyl-CoA carboxylase biotin carboxyl carrier protein